MAIRMSDTNNHIFGNLMTASGVDPSATDSNTFFDFEALKQKLHSLSIGGRNVGLDPLLRPLSQTNAFHSEDRQSSDISTNGWNSSDGLNRDKESIPEWSTPEPRVRPGMRAIRKNSDSDVNYTTPSNDGEGGREQAYKDWYSTYVQQTQRFAQMNGKPQNEKHVHFEDESPHHSLLRTNCSSVDSTNSMNGFNDNAFNDNAFNDSGIGSPPFDPKSEEGNNVYNFPKISRKGSVVNQFCDGFLKPVANNVQHNYQYMAQQWNQNMSHIQSTLNDSTLFGDSIWTNPSNPNNSIYRMFDNTSEGKSHLQKLLTSVRKAIPKSLAPNYTWSGQLPRRIRTKTPVYSCKVFLGGIPYDLTDSDLHCTFAQFGHIQIQWPGKDIRSAIEGAAANKAGYVYIIFENYDNVSSLLSSCTISYRDMDSGCRWYYNISSRRQKSKEVQVIPFDIGDRFFMKSSFSGQMEHSRTVFVGALHGMLAADGLAKVMDDLFGGVIFAGLDTDKFKYPLGSGRVTFDNQDSYLKAVSAAFVEVKSARFKKKIQIDPYIESESMCVVCRTAVQNPIYCREEGIYFCAKCWECHHSDPESANHRPIVKNKSSKV